MVAHLTIRRHYVYWRRYGTYYPRDRTACPVDSLMDDETFEHFRELVREHNMGVRRVNINGDDSDKSSLRREVLTELLRAGWPNVDKWCADIPYTAKEEAQDVHQKFLFDLCDKIVEGDIPRAGAISLGPVASKNLPRAMYLIGFCPEGGPETKIPMTWPVLSTEPERKFIDE